MKHLSLFAILSATLCGCTSSFLQQESTSSPLINPCGVASFLFEVKGYDGFGYRILLNEGKIFLFENKATSGPRHQTSFIVTPTKERWNEFTKRISSIGANHWSMMHEPSGESHDGASWKIAIIFNYKNDSMDVISFGRNAYPKDFNLMIDAISSLLGRSIESPNQLTSSPF